MVDGLDGRWYGDKGPVLDGRWYRDTRPNLYGRWYDDPDLSYVDGRWY